MLWYYNPDKNGFTSYPPIPEKILTADGYVDNPEVKELKTYTEEEVNKILQEADKDNKVLKPSGKSYVLEDNPNPKINEAEDQYGI